MKKLLLLILALCFTGISHASDSEEDLIKNITGRLSGTT